MQHVLAIGRVVSKLFEGEAKNSFRENELKPPKFA